MHQGQEDADVDAHQAPGLRIRSCASGFDHQAFRTIINHADPNSHARSAELLARYSDLLLRKGGRVSQTDQELDHHLSQTVRNALTTALRRTTDAGGPEPTRRVTDAGPAKSRRVG